MPILESEMPLEAMQKRAQTHKCGICKGNLVVCWGGAYGYNEYILRCAENFSHDTMTDLKQESKEYEEGNKLFRRIHGMDTKALMKMTEDTMLERIAQAKFPADLTPADKKLMAEVSISYGLDPVMQELMIYQGNPYPTINARYRKAQETGEFDGINTRPATAEEFKARHGEGGDIIYCAEVWRKGCSHPFVGWGRVRAVERKGNEHLPIVKDPDRQAEKRSEAMGLRKGFSMPVPFQSWEEFQEQRAEKVIDVEGVGKVNISTGEIVEGEIKEVKTSEAELGSCPIHNCPLVQGRGNFPPYCPNKVKGTGRSEGKMVWCKGKLPDEAVKPVPVAEEAPPELIPEPNEAASKKADVFQWIADKMKWKDTSPVRSWLVNACKITEAEIDSDPSGVYEKVKKAQNWED